jgi:hypothetical protein
MTVNGKTLTVAATTTSAATTATEIATAWNASEEPEFAEVTAEATSGGALTLTADTPGKPFTVTVTTTESNGGAADAQTFSRAATQANVSPNDVNDAVNWSNAAVPATDNVYLDAGAGNVPLKWNLDALSAVTVTSLNVFSGFTADAGLPKLNTDAQQYTEYRPDYWVISFTTLNFGDFAGGSGSGRFKLDGGSVQSAINVYGTGSPSETGLPALIWKGTHNSNAVRIEGGSFGAAVFGGEAATIATLTVTGGSCLCGPGCTLTTIGLGGGGALDTSSAVGGTATVDGGSWTHRAGTLTALVLNRGTVELRNGAALTITDLTIGPEGVLDLTNAVGAVTVTNTAVLKPGATIIDPNNKLATNFVYSATGGPNSVNVTRGAAAATVTLG